MRNSGILDIFVKGYSERGCDRVYFLELFVIDVFRIFVIKKLFSGFLSIWVRKSYRSRGRIWFLF